MISFELRVELARMKTIWFWILFNVFTLNLIRYGDGCNPPENGSTRLEGIRLVHSHCPLLIPPVSKEHLPPLKLKLGLYPKKQPSFILAFFFLRAPSNISKISTHRNFVLHDHVHKNWRTISDAFYFASLHFTSHHLLHSLHWITSRLARGG